MYPALALLVSLCEKSPQHLEIRPLHNQLTWSQVLISGFVGILHRPILKSFSESADHLRCRLTYHQLMSNRQIHKVLEIYYLQS
jgi:hypothetical protein